MSIYTDLAPLVTELLAEFDQYEGQVYLRRETGRATDPVTGVVTPGVVTETPLKGTLKPYADTLVDGTRILASDRELTIDGQVEPLTSDTVKIAGQPWAIVAVAAVGPIGSPVKYSIQVRR